MKYGDERMAEIIAEMQREQMKWLAGGIIAGLLLAALLLWMVPRA